MSIHSYVCLDPATGAAVWRRTDNVLCSIAAGAPGVGDDNTLGYEATSEWIDTTGAPDLWACVDPSTGAAVWQKIFPQSGGGGGGGISDPQSLLPASYGGL